MGFLEQSLLQVNYRNPVMLPDGALFFIKEQQMDVELLQKDADNWTLITRTTSSRIIPGWVPTKSTVAFTNADDPARFTAQYTLTHQEVMAEPRPTLSLDMLYASFATFQLVPGLFMREIFNASLALMWAGIPDFAEDIWTFQWTPGMGDGTARAIVSMERLIQEYIDLLVTKGIISYK